MMVLHTDEPHPHVHLVVALENAENHEMRARGLRRELGAGEVMKWIAADLRTGTHFCARCDRQAPRRSCSLGGIGTAGAWIWPMQV